jgi:hypothetical protein
MGEWMYRPTYSWLLHQLEVSGKLHVRPFHPRGKERQIPIGWADKGAEDLEDADRRKSFTLFTYLLCGLSPHANYTD